MGTALSKEEEGKTNSSAGIFEESGIRYYNPSKETFDPVASPADAESSFLINGVPKKATGVLIKDGKYTKNSNRRYIVLDGGFLRYYRAETIGTTMDDKNLAGTIDLRQYGLRNQRPQSPLNMVFVPINDDAEIREYDFEAHDAESRKSWERIIDAHARYYRDIK